MNNSVHGVSADGGRQLAYPSFFLRSISLLMLMVASAISFIDRQILSLLVVPIQTDLELSDTQVSVLLGFAFVVCYSIAGLPIGRWVDTGRRWTVVSAGIAFWSISTALCASAGSFGRLFVFRMGVGIGEASLNPAAYSLLPDLFPKRHLGVALAIFGLGIYAGAGLALIIGGQIIGALTESGGITIPLIGHLNPWQSAFLMVGLIGVPISIATLLMREPPRRGVEGREVSTKPPAITEVLSFLRSHIVVLSAIVLSWAMVFMAGYSVAAWQPTFLIRSHGWTPQEVGAMFGAVVVVGGGGGAILGGFLSDRAVTHYQSGRLFVVIVANSLAIPAAAIFPLVRSDMLCLFLVGLQTFMQGAATGASPAILQEIVPARMRGMMSSMALFVVSVVGLGFGPTVIALMTDYLFGDPSMLRYSLAIGVPIMLIISSLAALFALRPYSALREKQDIAAVSP